MKEHIDPVCGMTVTDTKNAPKSEYNGMTFYFCGKGCKVSFDKTPTKFVNEDGSLKKGGQISMEHH